jgi:hypothetical protein
MPSHIVEAILCSISALMHVSEAEGELPEMLLLSRLVTHVMNSTGKNGKGFLRTVD